MSRVADRLVALTLAAIDMATGSGDFGNARRWRDSMERAIRTGHTAAFIAGVNERLNKPADSAFTTARNLSRIERRELNAAIDKQLTYLDRFAASLDNLTPAQIAARAEMYAGAVRQTYNAQRWGAWDIPPELLPGSQTCLTRCRCSISVKDNGDGTGVLTRTLGGERHCDECPRLAGDHPVKRRGYAAKSYDGWDDSEIDGWTDDDAIKHMPGAHDQRSHGRATGRRTASRSAYSGARAAGATIDGARKVARLASQYMANAQRIENINKQLNGYTTDKTRRSLEAERNRLATEMDEAMGRLPPKYQQVFADAIRQAEYPKPTVRGRQDPRAAFMTQYSQAARDAHRQLTSSHTDDAKIEAAQNKIRAQRDKVFQDKRQAIEQRDQLILALKNTTPGSAEFDELTGRIKTVNARINRLQKQDEKLINDIYDVPNRMRGDAARRIVEVDHPAKITTEWGKGRVSFIPGDVPSASDQREINQVAARVSRLTSTPGLNGKPITVRTAAGVRAYANRDDNLIMLRRMESANVIAHEMGHHIEYNNPTVAERARAFLDRRTKGETPRPLRSIEGNQFYDVDEIATPDKFKNPYVGKRYAHGSTEIISMGIQYMFSDPVQFAKDDPDYFMFMYDVLRG